MSAPLAAKAPVVTDFGQYTRLRAAARNQDPAAIRQAAQQFEALFTQQLLKAAHASPLGDDLMGGDQGDMYRDMFDQQIAMQMASGKGLGLADLLVRQLKLSPQLGNDAAVDGKLAATAAATPAKAGMGWGHPAQQPIALAARVAATQMDPGVRVNAEVKARANDPTNVAMSDDAPDVADAAPGPAPASAAPLAPPDAAGSLFTSARDFIAAIRPHAEAAARALGLPAGVVIAQAALETGWGRHLMQGADGKPSFNFFGIKADKAWEGGRATHPTQEYEHGQMQRQNAQFRSYSSIGEAFGDYVLFLKSNPRYATALAHGGDAAHFAAGLQKAGYATDPSYAAKLLHLARSPTVAAALGAAPAVEA